MVEAKNERSMRPRRQKLSDLIVEDVKLRIVTDGLKPGDRLPNESELVERYQCGKATVREALKGLEVEGLVDIRSGPGGGASLTTVGVEYAARALRNFLHFRHLDSAQIYQLRKMIEVELAASIVGQLGDDDFHELEQNIHVCQFRPSNDDEQHQQRIAELDFHNLLARRCPNPLLSFLGQFLNDLLRDLVEWKQAFRAKRIQFGEANCRYHKALVEAYRDEDVATVRRLMREHMNDAERHMVALEAEVSHRFLIDHHAPWRPR